MRDVIWTIIGIWVFYKLYSAFTNRHSSASTVYQKHDHHHYHPDPEVKVNSPAGSTKTKKNIDDAEYTDFEEIK